MKTLCESILDDEDVLMGNIKKDTNNPFLVLYNYYISNGNNKRSKLAQRTQTVHSLC